MRENVSEQDLLERYERGGRTLTPEFIASIPWHAVKDHPLDPKFLPVLVYMRDVERLTEVYFDALRRTPTWRNKVVRRFMERWSTEEPTHSDLLERFLGEAGYPSEDGWYEKVKARIPPTYFLKSMWRDPAIAWLVGQRFGAVHMVWGAINEYTTLNGYARLSELAGHPVLTHILRAIMAEEAKHASFYAGIARLKLERSGLARFLARNVIERFWTPVGQGTKPKADTEALVRLMFQGDEGADFFDRKVSSVIRSLPGFEGLTTITDTIAAASS